MWRVDFASEEVGFAGEDTTMLATTDGGATWDDASFGLGGDIIGGGESWEPSFIGWTSHAHVRAVWMENATDAVIVGTETKIQYTRSFGQMPD